MNSSKTKTIEAYMNHSFYRYYYQYNCEIKIFKVASFKTLN